MTVFFFPYALLEVPSNIMLKVLRGDDAIWHRTERYRADYRSHRRKSLLDVPYILNVNVMLKLVYQVGIAEAGFFPASTFTLTTWYKRLELQKRMAIFTALDPLPVLFPDSLPSPLRTWKGWVD